MSATNEPYSGFVDGGVYVYMKDTNGWQLFCFDQSRKKPEISTANFPENGILLFKEDDYCATDY